MNKSIIGNDNPAFAFISSTNEEDTTTAVRAKSTKSAKTTTKRVDSKEKKDYRINLALTESLGEKVKAEAEKQDRSVNKTIELILLDYFNKRK